MFSFFISIKKSSFAVYYEIIAYIIILFINGRYWMANKEYMILIKIIVFV